MAAIRIEPRFTSDGSLIFLVWPRGGAMRALSRQQISVLRLLAASEHADARSVRAVVFGAEHGPLTGTQRSTLSHWLGSLRSWGLLAPGRPALTEEGRRLMAWIEEHGRWEQYDRHAAVTRRGPAAAPERQPGAGQ